jgi:hypothetical protein
MAKPSDPAISPLAVIIVFIATTTVPAAALTPIAAPLAAALATLVIAPAAVALIVAIVTPNFAVLL